MKLSKQQKRILDALNKGRVLTRLDGLEYGIAKIPSRVSELIAKGYPIHKANKKYYNRYGEPYFLKAYWIPENLRK